MSSDLGSGEINRLQKGTWGHTAHSASGGTSVNSVYIWNGFHYWCERGQWVALLKRQPSHEVVDHSGTTRTGTKELELLTAIVKQN